MIGLGVEHPPATNFARQVIAVAGQGYQNEWGVARDITLDSVSAVQDQQFRSEAVRVHFSGELSMDLSKMIMTLLGGEPQYVAAALLARTSFTDILRIDRELRWSAVAPAAVTDRTMLSIPRWDPKIPLSRRRYLGALLERISKDYTTVSWNSDRIPLAAAEITRLTVGLAVSETGDGVPIVSPFGSLTPEQLDAGIAHMTREVQQSASNRRWALEGDREYAQQATAALQTLPKFYGQ